MVESKLPSEVLKLGSRIVRELRLEPTDTLGRWMAHHLAEVIQDADSAGVDEREAAFDRAVDLILKLWSHKRSLPRGAYPLNDLESAMSVLGRLNPNASPYRWDSSDDAEVLLARAFDGLCHVVVHGVTLISRAHCLPDDYEATTPFLDSDEREFLATIKDWIDYAQTGLPKSPLVLFTDEERAAHEAAREEACELEKLDPETRSKEIFLKETDRLIQVLSNLRSTISARERGNKDKA